MAARWSSTASRSCRFPSCVWQFPSLALSNFRFTEPPETFRAARSSKSPVSNEVPPPESGHDNEAGSGKSVFPARETWVIPMELGGIGDGAPGLHVLTSERSIEKAFPCAFTFSVVGAMLHTGWNVT